MRPCAGWGRAARRGAFTPRLESSEGISLLRRPSSRSPRSQSPASPAAAKRRPPARQRGCFERPSSANPRCAVEARIRNASVSQRMGRETQQRARQGPPGSNPAPERWPQTPELLGTRKRLVHGSMGRGELPGTPHFPSGISFPAASPDEQQRRLLPGSQSRRVVFPRRVSERAAAESRHLPPPPPEPRLQEAAGIVVRRGFQTRPAQWRWPRGQLSPGAGRGAGSRAELGEDGGRAAFLRHSLLRQEKNSNNNKKRGRQTSEPGFTGHATSGRLPAGLSPACLPFPEPTRSFSRENRSPGDVVLDNTHDAVPAARRGSEQPCSDALEISATT